MSANLFTALFLVLLLCGTLLCGQLCAASGVQPQSSDSGKTIELFDKNKIEKADNVMKPDGGKLSEEITVTDYYSPFLVSANNVIVALAGVNRTDESVKNITVLTKFIEEKLLSADNVEETKSNWSTQFAAQSEERKEGFVEIVKCLLAVANKNKIYLLLVNQTKKTKPQDDYELSLVLAVGAVTDVTGPQKKITWSEHKLDAQSITNKLTDEFKKEKLAEYPFAGSAFLTDDGKNVFAFVVENAARKRMSVLISFKNDETEQPESVHTKDAGSCYPYFFPWGDKIVMVPVSCVESKMVASGDMGKQWEDSTGAFSRQYGFLKGKKYFTATKVENTPVLLFTEEKTKQPETQTKEVNLWMSDGNRSRKVGIIIPEFAETFYGSVLHVDDGLFLLYQKYKVQTADPKRN